MQKIYTQIYFFIFNYLHWMINALSSLRDLNFCLQDITFPRHVFKLYIDGRDGAGASAERKQHDAGFLRFGWI